MPTAEARIMPTTNPVPPGYRFHRTMIEEAAKKFDLDPKLVAAVCWQESAFNTDGFRFEPAFFNRYLKHKPEYASLNPRRISSSYGLMQVMAVVAIEDGTLLASENPEVLFQPERGLLAGCTRLAKLVKWSKTLPISAENWIVAVLASYNGGKGSNDKPPFRNGKYANEVLAKLALIQKTP